MRGSSATLFRLCRLILVAIVHQFRSLVFSSASLLLWSVICSHPSIAGLKDCPARRAQLSRPEAIRRLIEMGLSQPAGRLRVSDAARAQASAMADDVVDLASDPIGHGVKLIVAMGRTVSVVKVKPVVPPTIPIIFAMVVIKPRVVGSLNPPGDNVTGIAFLVNGLASKQIGLLDELVPKAS